MIGSSTEVKLWTLAVSHCLLGFLGLLGRTSGYNGGLEVALEELAVTVMLRRIGPENGRVVAVWVSARIVHSSVGITVDGDGWQGWVRVWNDSGQAWVVVGLHMPVVLFVLG